MALFVIIFLLLLVIPDIFIWWMFVRECGSTLLNIVWWLPAALGLAAAAAWAAGIHTDWLLKGFFVILLCTAVPKLVFMLFALAGAAAGVFSPRAAAPFYIAGLAVGVVMCICAVYGFTGGLRKLEVREAEVRSPRLPQAFDGYRIVHISDLHAGTINPRSGFLERLAAVVNGLSPDIILFTGDLVNASPAELKPHAATLAALKAPDGVWSVAGNHDYCEYARYDTPDGAARSFAEVVAAQRRMGWEVLLDRHTVIDRGGECIAVAGVQNVGRPPFPSRGDLAAAVAGIDKETFTVLLSHDPTHWRREVLPSGAADLTLSGHTHAMQFEIFGWSPSSLSYPEWGGIYREGIRTLNVSKGAGGTAPFRFGAWPEVTLITLRRSAD